MALFIIRGIDSQFLRTAKEPRSRDCPPSLQMLAPFRWRLAALCSLLWLLTANVVCGQSVQDFLALGNGTRVRNGVFALYAPDEARPVVLVRVGQAYRDYQRRGFFRIGVLPAGVFEGVTFEVMDIGATTNRLLRLDEWVRPSVAGAFELRRMKIIWGARTNSLEAGKVRIASRGSWELLDGVRLTVNGSTTEVRRAILQVTGAQAGELQVPAMPEWSRNLFWEEQIPKNNDNENTSNSGFVRDKNPDADTAGTNR
jgi:hypothetical protein